MLYQIQSRIKVESLMKGACRLVQQCGSVCSSFWTTGGFIDFGYAFSSNISSLLVLDVSTLQ